MKAAHKLEIRFSKSDIDIIPSLSLTRRPPAAGPGPGPGPPFRVLYKAPGHKNIKKNWRESCHGQIILSVGIYSYWGNRLNPRVPSCGRYRRFWWEWWYELIQLCSARGSKRVQGPAMSRCVLEDFKRCSDSLLWKLMMSFYDRRGVESWSRGIVPHFITCNAFIGSALQSPSHT